MTALADPRALEAQLRELAQGQSWAAMRTAVQGLQPQDAPTTTFAQYAWRALAALDDPAAEAWLDRALELGPGNATLQRAKAAAHQKRQEWLLAAERYRAAAVLRPDIAVYRGGLGTCLFQVGDYVHAAQELRAALAADASQRPWWIRLARSLVHLDAPADAAEAYRQALRIQDDGPTRSALQELERQIRTGSKAASSAYYDAVYAESAKYDQAGTRSEYAPVWEQIVAMLRERGVNGILDLGCGPGQFAEYVAAHLPGVHYTGLDFSEVAVAKGRQRCPQFRFEIRSLPTGDFADLPAFDVVVCTEVLEHVDPDREVIAALPAGTRLVASVPDFDAFGHLRIFRTEHEVRARYGALLDPLGVRRIRLAAQSSLWLLDGTRRAGA